MRFREILFVLCFALNIYQCRYVILKLTEVCLQTMILFSIDAHRYIQQHVNFSNDIYLCNETNLKSNYNLSQYASECPQHRYNIQVIERRPLIIYIEHFLTQNEIQHLIELANPIFVRSALAQINGSSIIDDNYRTSTTAYLKRSQTDIVKCIEQRFAQFQGNIDPLRLEPLQVVKYEPNQEFKPHVDWFHHSDQMRNGGQRLTTFFTYLHANCTMGETEFLNVKFDYLSHSRFCQILVCDDTSINRGLRFRPLPGNSIFWFNTNEDGSGDNASFHAGLPPGDNGLKLGLNTWTHETIFASL